METKDALIAGTIGAITGSLFAGRVRVSTQEPGQVYIAESYIISTDSIKTYAMNGITGNVDFQNTDAALVIQYANDNGKKTYIKDGTYNIYSPIIFRDGINFIGEGIQNTIFVIKSDLARIFDCRSTKYVKLDGFTVDANNKTITTMFDLSRTTSTVSRIQTNRIRTENANNCAQIVDSTRSEENIFYDCEIRGNKGIVAASNGGLTTIRNCYLACTDTSLDWNTGQLNIRDTSFVGDDITAHIKLTNTPCTIIDGCWFEGTPTTSILGNVTTQPDFVIINNSKWYNAGNTNINGQIKNLILQSPYLYTPTGTYTVDCTITNLTAYSLFKNKPINFSKVTSYRITNYNGIIETNLV